MLKDGGIVPGKLPKGYVPNMAYIGTEGYLVNCELWEGKQHCQKHTPEFLWETIRMCREFTDRPLLDRFDPRKQ